MPDRGWREPTASVALRWGGYRTRYLLALVLIVAGALLVQAGSAYAGYFIGIGFGAHVVGWLILPSRGVRRVIIAVPSAICASAPLIGSLATVLLVLCLLAWLWARQRPALSYIVLVFPLFCGVVLHQIYPQYGDGGIVVAVSLAVLVGSAWLASLIARTRRIPSANR
jgi:hypothetical protein